MIRRGSLVRIQPDPPFLATMTLQDSHVVRLDVEDDRFFIQSHARRSSRRVHTVRKARSTKQGEEEKIERGISSAGRAPALQAGGRRFDPVILHHNLSKQHLSGFAKGCLVVVLASSRQLGCSLTIHRVESALLAEMCFMALPCR